MFIIIFTVFLITHLYLIFSSRLLPWIDLPHHLAAATILRYYGEGSNLFAQYFTIESLFNSNVFHPIFCSLKIFPSVEIANKFYFALYTILLPVSILLLIRKVGGNQWFSLLSFLIIYNVSLVWGFVGFTMAIPLIVLLIYYLHDYFDNKSLWKRIVLSIIFFFLFAVHTIAALFGLFVFAVWCIYSNRDSFKRSILELTVILPFLCFVLIWYLSKQTHNEFMLFNFLIDYYSSTYFSTIYERGSLLFLDTFRLFDGFRGFLIGSVFTLFIVIPGLYGLFKFYRKQANILIPKNSALIIVFVLCSLTCFCFLPIKLPYFYPLYQRFSTFVLIAFIIIGSLYYTGKRERLLIMTFIFMCFTYFMLWMDYFRDFQEENRDFNKQMFSEITGDKSLSGIVYEQDFRGFPVYIHFPNYYIIWNKGIAVTKIVDYKYNIIKRRVSKKELPPYVEVLADRPTYDGRYDEMDYLLIRGKVHADIKGRFNFNIPLKSAGRWLLYGK
ncbi:MAG: hypothetical protein GY855_04225 [candidate division Zixibacteria bacterium]|nr:hypothetical protein [candidate division Zixibacteria bacterium]